MKNEWRYCRDQLPPYGKMVLVNDDINTYQAKRVGFFMSIFGLYTWKTRSGMKGVLSETDQWKYLEE
jgi:hypothetical protein